MENFKSPYLIVYLPTEKSVELVGPEEDHAQIREDVEILDKAETMDEALDLVWEWHKKKGLNTPVK